MFKKEKSIDILKVIGFFKINLLYIQMLKIFCLRYKKDTKNKSPNVSIEK